MKNDYNKPNKYAFTQKAFVQLLPKNAADKSFVALWDWERWFKNVAFKYSIPLVDKCEDGDCQEISGFPTRINPETLLLEYYNGTEWTSSEAPEGFATSYIPTGASQALSGTGALTAVSITGYYTSVVTTGAATGTLADGTVMGQRKKIKLITDGGDFVLTPANFTDTTITFNDAGDYVELLWNGTDWIVLENSGTTIA